MFTKKNKQLERFSQEATNKFNTLYNKLHVSKTFFDYYDEFCTLFHILLYFTVVFISQKNLQKSPTTRIFMSLQIFQPKKCYFSIYDDKYLEYFN